MNTKKLFIGITATVMAFSLVASPVLALTQAQINSILDMIAAFGADSTTIANVEAALKGQPVTTPPPATDIPATCIGVTFTRNLSQGSDGSDVKCLQALLNTDSATQVALTGAGSPNNETNYFGPMTKAAVVKFQEKYAATILTPAGLTAGSGIVGQYTRVKLNAMLVAVDDEEPPDEDEDDDADDADEDEDDDDAEVGEGDLTFKLLAVPSNVTVRENDENVSVMAFELKAYDSDINVRRIDLRSDTRLSRHLDYVSLYEGTNAVTGVNATSFERPSGQDYYRYRFDSLSINIPKGTTKTIHIKVSALANIKTGGTIIFTIPTDGIRYQDTLGLHSYLDGGSRSFATAGAQVGTLSMSLHADSPKEGTAIVSRTSTTEEIDLLVFNLQAKVNAVEIEKLQVDVFASDDADSVISAVRLYVGSDLAATETVTDDCEGSVDYCAVFDRLFLEIARDATKKITVKVDVYALDEDTPPYSEGEAISATVLPNAESVLAIDANDEQLEDGHISGTMTGETIYLYLAGPVVSNISSELTETPVPDENNTQWMTGKIHFTLSALGYDIVIPTDGIVPVAMNLSDEDDEPETGSIMVTIGGKNLASASLTERTISAGSSKKVSAVARINPGDQSNGDHVYLMIGQLNWTWEDGTGTLPTEILTNLVTQPKVWNSGL